MPYHPLLIAALGVGGLVAGSLLNVVIVCVPTRTSPAPRARCARCGQPLTGLDRIPVVPWLVLRGRCRSCSEAIPPGHPLVEIVNAALWVAAGLRFGPHLVLVPFLALFSVLLALSVIDLELYILPNRITYPSILASLVVIPFVSFVVVDDPVAAVRNAIAGGVGYAAFLLVTLEVYRLVARRDGMGIGDVKLALLIGLYLGWIQPVLALVSLIMASLIGLAAGVAVLVARRGRNEPYPFGPWLALSGILAVLFSRQLLSLYGL